MEILDQREKSTFKDKAREKDKPIPNNPRPSGDGVQLASKDLRIHTYERAEPVSVLIENEYSPIISWFSVVFAGFGPVCALDLQKRRN
eukprot:scaffold426011_cov27-Prasinocladus_malaysianus.AAC.1